MGDVKNNADNQPPMLEFKYLKSIKVKNLNLIKYSPGSDIISIISRITSTPKNIQSISYDELSAIRVKSRNIISKMMNIKSEETKEIYLLRGE